MKTELSETQVQQYRRDGFVIVRGFLDNDELADWREAVGQALEARGNQRVLAKDMNTDPDDYYSRVFTQRVNLWQDSPAIRRLMLDPRLGKLAAELAGVDGIRIWHDQALVKPPWGNPTAWHLDNPYWSFHSPDAISIWVALDDATLTNGCLAFIPGSHRQADPERNVTLEASDHIGKLFDAYPEWTSLDPVYAEMKAGDASFHNGLTAHGAGANMTPRARRAMTCAYMPDGSTFNGQENILPPDKLEALSVGDPLNDNAFNPLLFSHSREVDLTPLLNAQP